MLTARVLEILLVEDSPTDRLLTLEALQSSEILRTTNVVENGVDAMAYLRQEGKFSGAARPDLILLDLNLPKKDGREVLAEIKTDRSLKLIPVIILTTSQSDEDLLGAYGAHANSYVTKPVDFARLTTALRALGSYWSEVVTLPPKGVARDDRIVLHAAARKPGDQLRVLLIEDDPTDTLLVREALEASELVEFSLGHVTRLADAVERLRVETFDLVMMDLDLPDSQGLDSLRSVRGAAPGLPLIVLTGLDDDSTGVKALRRGADDYLVKGRLSARSLARAARYAIDRKHYQEQLQQSERLDAVGRLAAGIAHDLNNILSVLRANAELLPSAATPRAVADISHEIEQATQRASGLSRQLLTFGRKQAVQANALDLNRVVADFMGILRPVLGESVELELLLAPELPSVMGDAGLLDQVLLNLCINARDAMPAGGKLRLQTELAELTPTLAGSHPEAYAGRFARLSVSDSGAGMPPAVAARVFEPFFTTKTTGQHAGLGLSNAYGIVQQHRGWLTVESRMGVGTCFEVYLPVTERKVPDARAASPTVGESAHETILLVEDERALLRLTGQALRRAGYRVLEADCAEQAHAVWARHADEIDLALCDMVLPDGQTGRRLIEALALSRPALKVIFMSGYSPDFSAPDFVLTEGVNFLQKPYRLDQLLQLVRQRLHTAPA